VVLVIVKVPVKNKLELTLPCVSRVNTKLPVPLNGDPVDVTLMLTDLTVAVEAWPAMGSSGVPAPLGPSNY
jgi:hypothetical protein